MPRCAAPTLSAVAEAVVPPAKGSRRRTAAVLALSTGLHALAALHTFTIPAIAPEMAAGLGADASLVGVQVLLVCLAGMVMSPFAGAIVIYLGTVRAVQASMVLGAIGVALAALLVVFPFMTADWAMPYIYIFLAVLGVAGAGWNGVFVSELLRLAPRGDSPRALGGGLTFGFAGSLVGLALFAMSHRLFASYSATTWAVTATACVGFLFSLRALVLVRSRR